MYIYMQYKILTVSLELMIIQFIHGNTNETCKYQRQLKCFRIIQCTGDVKTSSVKDSLKKTTEITIKTTNNRNLPQHTNEYNSYAFISDRKVLNNHE